MHEGTRLSAVVALSPLLFASGTINAQPQPATGTNADQRMEQLERRLDEMDKRHAEELRARDEEIARLKSRADEQPTTRPARPSPAPPDEIEQTRQDILRDLETNRATPFPATGTIAGAGTSLGLTRNPVSFNPDFAVITDFVTSYSPDRDNDAYNRLDVRELEFDLRAAVDPRADAVAVVAFGRDVDNLVFPETGAGAPSGPDTSVHLEEAYLFFHDFGVPNLTAKLGRFHVRFGRQNILHLHDLPTTDPAFVNQAFLAPEALSDAGLSLSYVIPPERIGGQYVEVIGEILAGEGGDSESPTLTGDLTVDSPAFNTHLLWNSDLPWLRRQDLNLELGGSWLVGHRGPDNDLDVNLFGLDATLIRTDPTGRFRNSLLQGEAMWALVDQDDNTTDHAFGVYVLGQQQLNKDWYAGLRLDWTQDPNDDKREAWGFTPYVSWYWSEFLRFRASYQHRDGDRPAEDAVWLQVTWIFGAHPPHPYWAMR